MSETKCPFCNSENTETISRVVGYFSKVQNWSPSKKEEREARKQGSYQMEEKLNDN